MTKDNLFETFKELPKPFNKKGEPNKFLRLILPFFSRERNTKVEMLKSAGVDIIAYPNKRNCHSHILASLSSKGVLSVKARGSGHWKRGDNWELFLSWLTLNMIENKKLKARYKDMLVQYETNALDFIMKDSMMGFNSTTEDQLSA